MWTPQAQGAAKAPDELTKLSPCPLAAGMCAREGDPKTLAGGSTQGAGKTRSTAGPCYLISKLLAPDL